MALGLPKSNSDRLARSVLYTTANLGLYEINPASAVTADSGSAPTAVTEGTIRAIVNVINPLMFEAKSDGDVLIAICDNSQWDANGIKRAVDTALGVTNTTVTKQTTILGLA